MIFVLSDSIKQLGPARISLIQFLVFVINSFSQVNNAGS